MTEGSNILADQDDPREVVTGAAVSGVLPATISGLSDSDPREVGGYQLDARLERGGWGSVYLGRSPAGELVTVRVFDPVWAEDPGARSALMRGLLAARRTAGTSWSARVLEFQTDDAVPYVVTEFVEGHSLRTLVTSQGPLAGPALDRLATDSLTALTSVQEAGVVHRSLAPDSMVFGRDGLLLFDVGLSRFAGGTPPPIDPADVNWWYTAPEILRGQRAEAAGDLFAWAATMAFAAQGRAPYEEPDVDGFLRRIALSEPDLTGVPPHFRDLVHRCLAEDPRQRPTARQARDQVREVLRRSQAAAATTGPAPAVTTGPAPAATTGPAPAATTEPGGRAGVLPDGGLQRARGPRRVRTGIGTPAGTLPVRGWTRRRSVVAQAVAGLAALLTLGVVVAARNQSSGPGPGSHPAAPTGTLAPACPAPPAGALADLVPHPDEGCYGYTDSGTGFGRDPASLALQSVLFAGNRPVAPGDLTVIWLGPLTCPRYLPDGRCADGRVYEAERQELAGLRLARDRTGPGTRIHVVIANTGSDFGHVVEVARLIAAHRTAFGRVTVIGANEGRSTTKGAIQALLSARIPVISSVTSTDQGLPGQSFVTRPGYLQLSPPNRDWAATAGSLIAHYTPAQQHRQVIVYHAATPGDEYTESFARDMLAVAGGNPVTATPAPQLVTRLDQIPVSVCADHPSPTLPAALFFSDRWTAFAQFAARLTSLCGAAGPAMLVSNDSVSRFMTNDDARRTVTAPWPMAYFRKGKQCADLELAATQEPLGEAAALLSSARSALHACTSTEDGGTVGQIGDRVSRMWDAVSLATRVVPTGTTSDIVADTSFTGTGGPVQVRGGVIVTRPAPSPALCVRTVDLSKSSARSVAECDIVFAARDSRTAA